MVDYAHKHQCDVIISYHNYEMTPPADALRSIVEECYQFGADVAKIATMAQNHYDVANILSLYGNKRRIVAVGMGKNGMITRIMAVHLGAEFTFAAPDGHTGTAPGQLSKSELLSEYKRFQEYFKN